MDYKVVVTAEAEEDLNQFIQYLLFAKKNEQAAKNLLLTTVKNALSVSLYEGIIFLSYFKEKRIKKCQKKDVIQFKSYRKS
ncbi:MAG: hypothetical protein ACLVA6_06315 [Dorea sp.]|nr:hypothetical protein [bacterium 210928-DFI.3.100]